MLGIPHLYCISCKAQLDNCRHHPINNPLLKFYLCARLSVVVLDGDRICIRCRSSFDYWKTKFGNVINDFIANAMETDEVSGFDSFLFLLIYLSFFQTTMDMKDSIGLTCSIGI